MNFFWDEVLSFLWSFGWLEVNSNSRIGLSLLKVMNGGDHSERQYTCLLSVLEFDVLSVLEFGLLLHASSVSKFRKQLKAIATMFYFIKVGGNYYKTRNNNLRDKD